MQVTSQGISLEGIPPECLSVDVEFDGRRVWTIARADLSPHGSLAIDWPLALRPYLVGKSEITLRSSATLDVFFVGDVQFSESVSRVTVSNLQGAPLTVNKWGNLAPALVGLEPATLRRLLSQTKAIIEDLAHYGLRPFIVGGTLLGAVRDNALLPHDDDADIAYLSHLTNPVDVAIEAFALGHYLESLGYEFIRHSAVHFQLVFRDATGAIEFHIDIFSAFFSEDGRINQPFHVRGKLSRPQMLPFGTVQIDGHGFPAPADTDAWLTLNYDANWRTPIPGYRLRTPESTVRRFDNWFGGFNFKREFWDAAAELANPTEVERSSSREWLASRAFVSRNLLDLGSGAGHLSAELAAADDGRRVIAADYSAPSRALSRIVAEDLELPNVETLHLNLNRLSSLAAPCDAGVAGSFDIVADHLFEQINSVARTHALRLVRMSLRSGGRAFATAYARPAPNLTTEDPSTWHISWRDLHSESASLGLATTFVPLNTTADEVNRSPYGVEFTLGDSPAPTSGLKESAKSMIRRFKAFLTQNSQSSRLSELQEQMQEMKAELDEYRRDSLRVAELLDLLETRLTPGNDSTSE